MQKVPIHFKRELDKGISSFTLQGRVKYPDVDIFRFTGLFFRFGLAVSLGVIFLAFNWTRQEDSIFIPEGANLIDEWIEIVIPPTVHIQPPPPPPPQVVEIIADERILNEEDPQFVDQSIIETSLVEAPPIKIDLPPAPPPLPVVENSEDDIFKVVEQMPRFPGCEEEVNEEAKKSCAERKLIEFLYRNIKYPALARENGIEGQLVVRFIVEKDGTITDSEVLRDISAGCGDEALRVINLMNNMGEKWTPGKQRGRAVRVQFNLPVKFQLE